MKKYLFILFVLLIPLLGVQANEADSFFIQSNYDLEGRSKTKATLILETDSIDYYGDVNWWKDLTRRKKDDYKDKLSDLSIEFEEEIEPKMTDQFGGKPVHPVTGEKKVSVLFHPMQDSAGGYFNSGDQHSKYQDPQSNEMSLLYLNTDILDYENIGGFLAHEFMHLLTFNQKERLRGVREEVWLNELRAEYIPTFLGYNDEENSTLDKRIETFLKDPDISMTEWVGQRADYGVISMFGHYIVDHYGVEILSDSLKSNKVGIPSINEALKENGYEKNFSDVFNDFKLAVLINDCEVGEKYCFKNEKLKDLEVTPATNYIPYTKDGSVSVKYRTKNWAGNWHKITGGQGILELDFEVKKGLKVSVPYVLHKTGGGYKVGYMKTEDGQGTITVEKFDDKYDSLIIMPSIEEKKVGFNGAEESYLFEWTAHLIQKEEELQTLEKLSRLRELLYKLKERLSRLESSPRTCTIRGPLYKGITDSESVVCLQLFLSTQEGVYPEGYVTGNFLRLTEKAVIRFQEKYAPYILRPIGLKEGTGYVGPRTISMINNLR